MGQNHVKSSTKLWGFLSRRKMNEGVKSDEMYIDKKPPAVLKKKTTLLYVIPRRDKSMNFAFRFT